MTWYYVQNGVQQGPLEQTALEALVREGTIGAETLVWREGMENWQPYSGVATLAKVPATVLTEAGPAPGLALATCSHCGQSFPVNEVVKLGGRSICAGCKPIVLQSMQEGVSLDTDAEQTRKAHISHEASVKSIGLLYFLSGGMMVLAGGMMFLIPASGRGADAGVLIFGVVFIALAGLLIGTGAGLRKLRPWSRIVSAVLAAFGLLGFPLGTLINGYILYLLLSKKGSMVFSDPYQQVIAATPHIKYRTSIIVWIFLIILILLMVAAIFAGIFAG